MARERYLLDETEDTIHQNQIVPTTASDKRKNWWFYHKTHTIVALIVVVFVVVIVHSFVTRETPDYTIAIMTEYSLPNDLLQDIEEHLERYADDRNGDGETVVSLQYYHFSSNTTSDYEAAELQASFVKFAADASGGDSIIFIYDDESYRYLDNNDMSDFFGPIEEGGEDYILLKDMAGLNNLTLNHYAEDGNIETVMNVIGNLKVSVRTEEGTAFDKEEKVEYREDCIEMYKRLRDDVPVNTAAE